LNSDRAAASRPKLIAAQNAPYSFVRYVREFADLHRWDTQTVKGCAHYNVLNRLKLLRDDDIATRQDLLDWVEERFPTWYVRRPEVGGRTGEHVLRIWWAEFLAWKEEKSGPDGSSVLQTASGKRPASG
jgi:hypothetical protein